MEPVTIKARGMRFDVDVVLRDGEPTELRIRPISAGVGPETLFLAAEQSIVLRDTLTELHGPADPGPVEPAVGKHVRRCGYQWQSAGVTHLDSPHVCGAAPHLAGIHLCGCGVDAPIDVAPWNAELTAQPALGA